ncbi:MAG: metal-sulfur cluster assembly factor [Nanopusillaceae archaeon]
MKELEKIIEKLREVIDPELGYDIVSLGEIKDIKIFGNKVEVTILPTTPFCPFLPFIQSSIYEKLSSLGYTVDIKIDFEDKWNINRVDPQIRKYLGIFR